mmetsp:Transcript_38317/g.108370  ORF Transcript_38317/g.108370 Transcript_38317/m.108370 type:complete len:219 (-) Transcript_38317:301-957(-)
MASALPSTCPPAALTQLLARALTIERAVSGLSVAAPGSFFTGENSSSRVVSKIAMRLLMENTSKMKPSSLMPLFFSGFFVLPASSANGIFLWAAWNMLDMFGITSSARNAMVKKWLQMFPAPKTSRPASFLWFLWSSLSSEYSTTPGRPSNLATTPTFSSGLTFHTHLFPQSASREMQYPMKRGSAGRQSTLSMEKTWRYFTPFSCKRVMHPLFCRAG